MYFAGLSINFDVYYAERSFSLELLSKFSYLSQLSLGLGREMGSVLDIGNWIRECLPSIRAQGAAISCSRSLKIRR